VSIPTPTLSADEFLALSLKLEEYHAVFYQLWKMGRPVFTNEIETAAVSFDSQGDWVEFVFNPKYWNSLNEYQRLFVICHECLHIILNHGIRTLGSQDHEVANYLLDVIVNHALVRGFGFDRALLGDLNKKGCWVDTVFVGEDMPDDKSFEYYFNRMPKNLEKLKLVIRTLDDHAGLGTSNWDEVVGKLDGVLSKEEKDALKDTIEKHYEAEVQESQAGVGTGGWTFIDVKPVKKKKKWETVIKEWSRKYDRPEMKDIEQWARVNRRFVTLDKKLMLPTEMEIEHETEGKIMVFLFQDTSGSCWNLKDRFFKAARSLDPKRFDVRLFCFDTAVKEVELAKGKIYGGGGTSFGILEAFIQKTMLNEGCKYPEAVFLITDGMGNSVRPEKPERWYWFLSYDCRHYIPKESNVFKLSDYE